MKDAYYFPHFCNARHDRKIMRLRKELGVEGYGIFFMLLEVLRDQIDFKYPITDIDLLAEEFGCSEQKVKVVICNYQLFEVDPTEQFFSPKLLLYLQPYLNMKEQRRLAGLKSGEVRKLKSENEQPLNNRSTTVEQPLNENEQSKVKEKKVNESKVKEIKEGHKTALESAIDDFKIFRKKIKKEMTDHAVVLLKKELDKLASDDEMKIKILDQSILNSWQGVFVLKEEQQPIYQNNKNQRIKSTDSNQHILDQIGDEYFDKE